MNDLIWGRPTEGREHVGVTEFAKKLVVNGKSSRYLFKSEVIGDEWRILDSLDAVYSNLKVPLLGRSA